MKKILLTGSNGMLGGKIIKHLLDRTEYEAIAVAASEEKVNAMIEREQIASSDRIHFLANDELINQNNELDDVFGAIHLAFARRNRPAQDIASSIDYASMVFEKLAASSIERVINVSSQGVYGSFEDFRTEQTVPAPATQYTMAKYATEVLFNSYFSKSSVPYHTNIRLDLVIQNQNLVPALCNQAKNGQINLKGGEQRFSFIDSEDAADGIMAMLLSNGPWNSVYNLGWNRKRYTLVEVAELVASVAEKNGYDKPEIILDKQDISLWAGMDSSKFLEHTGWSPGIDIENMIKRIFGESN